MLKRMAPVLQSVGGSPIGSNFMRRVIAIALAAICLAQPVHAEQRETELFFFSPDWSTGNLSVLTEAAERYIGEAGFATKFQAFARYEDFAKQVQQRKPAFLIVPSWVQKNDSLGIPLMPVGRPVRDGQTSYRKALMAGPAIHSARELTHGSIAAAVHATGPDEPSEILGHFGLKGTSARVIPVPKDIDALLALSFGQVDAALVTSAQVDMLQRVNPNSTKDLHVLAMSPAVPFPTLVSTPYATKEQIARASRALPRLLDTQSGKQLLELLGYDMIEAVVPNTGAFLYSDIVYVSSLKGLAR